ncbi:MAG: putative toxin-antitoxin system toxin component, PIN family [Armatimonadetes bacterium]|nr:putative toxin-antitoxin system toxin component, PIN family [Armatimonadota bacterium]
MNRRKPAAVFDTGIILQATISRTGPATKLLRQFDEGAITLFVSEELLAEMRDVLFRPSIRTKNVRYSDEGLENLLQRLEKNGVMVTRLPEHFQYERDADDEHVINLAIEAGAEFLVSRDKDLLDLASDAEFTARFPNLTILDPVAFLNRIYAE